MNTLLPSRGLCQGWEDCPAAFQEIRSDETPETDRGGGVATMDTFQRVIAERRFQLVYQPIVHLDTGEVLGVEALCRFADGRSPERWFRDAEAAGAAADLDIAILQTALGEAAALPDGYLSLNVSPSTLADPRLLDVLGAPDVAARRLVVEITEHARVANYSLVRQTLRGLRRLGV